VHDVRFVEDNWNPRPLGAWGLGWGSLADGIEGDHSSPISSRSAALNAIR